MTEHFQKMVSRLARANNFEDGAFVLITKIPEEKQPTLNYKGFSNIDLWELLYDTVATMLTEAELSEAEKIRECLKKIIIEDEQRRFQNKPIGEV